MQSQRDAFLFSIPFLCFPFDYLCVKLPVLTVHSKKDIIKLLIVYPIPVFDEPHRASVGRWQSMGRSGEKNLLSFKPMRCCSL